MLSLDLLTYKLPASENLILYVRTSDEKVKKITDILRRRIGRYVVHKRAYCFKIKHIEG